MNKDALLEATAVMVKQELKGRASWQDWWHTLRVWKISAAIGQHEDCDLFLVQMAALLHDLSDWRIEKNPMQKPSSWLAKQQLNEADSGHILTIIKDMSYKGGREQMPTIEGRVVQDAHLLDELGAIGIARLFAFGQNEGLELHNPHPSNFQTPNSKPTALHILQGRLLTLRERMNTSYGKKLAQGRQDYMKRYLKRFLKEWNSLA
jgi:uncharacterized protein